MNDTTQNFLNYYLSAPHPCSYLQGRTARSQVLVPGQHINTHIYGQLLQMGFRRSGFNVYQPHCEACQACIPVRVDVHAFQAHRTQRRIKSKNMDLELSEHTPYFDAEHYALYQRYQTVRHAGGGMDHDDPDQYQDFLLSSHVDTRLLVFRQQGIVRMVSLVDLLDDGLSAVYTFFDTDFPTRSLGVFNVLSQIEWAHRLGLPYLYLGYWIKDSRKMSYKQQYQPLQGRLNGQWTVIT